MDKKYTEMIERIYNEIVGDEYTEGLIPKVTRNTEKIRQHDIYFKVVIGLFSLISGLLIFWDSFQKIIK